MAVFQANALQEAGAIVCDGVGSMAQSGEVAAEVAGIASQHLARRGVGTGFITLEKELQRLSPSTEDGATTLAAVGADATGLVGFMLIGNGSVIEVAATDAAPGRVRLRWVDLALPHFAWQGGHAALRSFLPWPPGASEVTVGYRRVDLRRTRLFLVCSDGIASDEDRRQATTPDGSVWKEVPRPLATILDHLADDWKGLSAEIATDVESRLQTAVTGALRLLLDSGDLDDDASAGCVLLRPEGSAKAS